MNTKTVREERVGGREGGREGVASQWCMLGLRFWYVGVLVCRILPSLFALLSSLFSVARLPQLPAYINRPVDISCVFAYVLRTHTYVHTYIRTYIHIVYRRETCAMNG